MHPKRFTITRESLLNHNQSSSDSWENHNLNCIFALFLMKYQTASVRTWSFVHFILPHNRLQTRHTSKGIFKDIETKRRCCVTILDPTVMPHHTSVSNCFYYVITIDLSFITDRLKCTEYVCIFDWNHSSVHLWRIKAVKHTQLLSNHSSGCLL